MARISKFALFWRAFLVSLIVGAPTTGNRAYANDTGDWASAIEQGTFESFVWYLKRNPTGAHIEEALAKLVTLSQNGRAAPEAARSAAAPGEAAGTSAGLAAGVAAGVASDSGSSLY